MQCDLTETEHVFWLEGAQFDASSASLRLRHITEFLLNLCAHGGHAPDVVIHVPLKHLFAMVYCTLDGFISIGNEEARQRLLDSWLYIWLAGCARLASAVGWTQTFRAISKCIVSNSYKVEFKPDKLGSV